ncbi:hypothetical protein DPSP01_010607 [Paraphaeosphaeria sporulosa]
MAPSYTYQEYQCLDVNKFWCGQQTRTDERGPARKERACKVAEYTIPVLDGPYIFSRLCYSRVKPFDISKQITLDEDISCTAEALNKLADDDIRLLLRQKVDDGLAPKGRKWLQRTSLLAKIL